MPKLNQNDTNRIVPHAFSADGAYPANTRMKMSGTFGILTAAGDEDDIGTLARRTKASGDEATLIAKYGYDINVAGGVIAAGASATTAAAGKLVTGTGGAVDPGIALTAASGDGDNFLLLRTS